MYGRADTEDGAFTISNHGFQKIGRPFDGVELIDENVVINGSIIAINVRLINKTRLLAFSRGITPFHPVM
jgi:hypothetical protein